MTDSITYFRQREPGRRERGTETTVMKLVRDREARYVGVRAFDRDPLPRFNGVTKVDI